MMDSPCHKLKSQLLNEWNDHTQVVSYGDGCLVYLPWHHDDDDAVGLYIQALDDTRVRISDQGSTLSRLQGFDQFGQGGSFDHAWRQALGGLRTHAIGTDGAGPEIAVTCEFNDVAAMTSRVASACLRASQTDLSLRCPGPGPRFDTQITQALSRLVSHFRSVSLQRHPAVTLKTGRPRTVTARIDQRGTPRLWVQAVSGKKPDERESQVSKCFLTFSQGEFDTAGRLAVLAGTESSWPAGMADDLREVATNVLFSDETERIDKAVRTAVQEPLHS